MRPEDLRRLEAVGGETEFAAGQVVIERGQHGSGLFVILEGEVVVETAEGPVELGPGACVGERALLAHHGRRAARVRAVTDVRALAVDRAQVDRLLSEDPGLADRLAEAAGG